MVVAQKTYDPSRINYVSAYSPFTRAFIYEILDMVSRDIGFY